MNSIVLEKTIDTRLHELDSAYKYPNIISQK